jgi:hypothetical protein
MSVDRKVMCGNVVSLPQEKSFTQANPKVALDAYEQVFFQAEFAVALMCAIR